MKQKHIDNCGTFLYSVTVTNSSSNRSVFGVSQLQVIVLELITENLSWRMYKQRIVYIRTCVISTAWAYLCARCLHNINCKLTLLYDLITRLMQVFGH
jgi:hypothetical protein